MPGGGRASGRGGAGGFFPAVRDGGSEPRARENESGWTWADIHRLAALAGAGDPGPFSARELAWRAEALARDRWDRTAYAAWVFARALGATRASYDEFHPLRAAERKTDLAALDRWIEDMRGRLGRPDDAEERWARAREKLARGRR
ncbi:MAG: hypothetical protein N3A38_07620 [Planctomycetota bacterium]|nr:hypothetical protein [Planctomycetota bacterium]